MTQPPDLRAWLAGRIRRRRTLDLLGAAFLVPAGLAATALVGAAFGAIARVALDALGIEGLPWIPVAVGVTVAALLLAEFRRLGRRRRLGVIEAVPKRSSYETAGEFAFHAVTGRLAVARLDLTLANVMDVVYFGPSLVGSGIAGLARARRLRRLDVEAAARVVAHLGQHEHRRGFEELARTFPDVGPETVIGLGDVDGVLFLVSEPAGLALASDLRRELAAAGLV